MADTTCSIEGCSKPSAKRSWCGMHYERWRKHGDPAVTLLPRSDGYLAVHKRVHRRRGKARHQVCPCGQPAAQWAYDHQDPDELQGWVTVRKARFLVTYSAKLEHYVAMCIPCHRKMDAA